MSFWKDEIYIYNNFKIHIRIANHTLGIMHHIPHALNKNDVFILYLYKMATVFILTDYYNFVKVKRAFVAKNAVCIEEKFHVL